jgi:hypothetical protein
MKKAIYGGLLFVGGSVLLVGGVISAPSISGIIGFPGVFIMVIGLVIGALGLREGN